ncbi:MAG TPA: phage tail sheath C-terminal domain-containing protein [Thermoanaerobaculia bacterium]|nr:phage tail sheath C-terminal domain-containing protein [Thermoanaerobaculia bacterium]
MAELVLPGVSIEVRDEGLLIPLGVSVGNLGVVGTASKGPVDDAVLLGSYGEAREIFGDYDPWVDGESDELTLVRALEQAFRHGAGAVFAVRVADGTPAAAVYTVAAAGGSGAELVASTPGTWGNEITIEVAAAEERAFIRQAELAGGNTVALRQAPETSAQNRVRVRHTTGQTRVFRIVGAAPVAAGEVQIDGSNLVFFNNELTGDDRVFADYVVPLARSREVTLRQGSTTETFVVADGQHLVDQISAAGTGSRLVTATEGADPDGLLNEEFAQAGTRGGNGEGAATTDYDRGFELLLNEPAHIMVAAGLDSTVYGTELKAHCEAASGDTHQAERIGVTGSALNATFDQLRGHGLDSPRLIFVAPGIRSTDAASGREVTLPGAYAAAAIAGMLSAVDPEVSLTNKAPSVDGLEQRFSRPQLSQLVQSRVLVLEDSRDRGIRVVKGITTATNTAWHQITTRRIVDYAIFGTRSAGRPFIGRLNNERVRGALRTSINSFLADMVTDEMLVSYELDVTATRDQEIRGIVQVTMVLRPVFSIDFIKVTIFLQ